MSKIKQLTIQRLNTLKDPKKQISYCYLVCKRLLPNYSFFSKEVHWGDPSILTDAINMIETFIVDDATQFNSTELLLELDKNTPDSDDFSTHYCRYAQNAVNAIYYTLNNLRSVNVEELSWVHSLSLDTIYAFVHNTEDFISPSDLIDDPQNHWMMKRELSKQDLDFKSLMSAPVVDKAVLQGLTAFNEGKSNIHIN